MEVVKEFLEPGRVKKYKFTHEGKILSFKEVINLMATSVDFRNLLTDVLVKCPFKGYYWEVKPITAQLLNTEFEFVAVNSNTLPNIIADKSPFLKYFATDKQVVTFPNLRGDAQLVVPIDISDDFHYAHMADFVRNAPPEQVDEMWQLVTKEYSKLIGESPRWLSTAGLGVSWLHVRIDSTPKYYRFQPYKSL
ncbi:DUF6940 family protein [Chondrinema litorale]|uniref:DUF6940 family protein n=1 Tax=Chondrinema litorale TaxID=2994555 RepID=UPI002543534C|nr:hypothetical protein [Chondrinema litorale]UZR96178.1 hypothetical protein OQ292_10205 [Chondrinema litorale]